MEKISFLAVFATSCLLAAIPSHASEKLVSWSKSVNDSFDAKGCVTLPKTPGIPKECSPATNIRYPCGVNSNLQVKMCSQHFPSACTPAVPSIASSHACTGNSLGRIAVAVDGSVSLNPKTSDPLISVDNSLTLEGFGQQVTIPMTCRFPLGVIETKVCVDVFNAKITEQGLHETCEIGSKVGNINYTGVTAQVCTDLKVKPFSKNGLVGASGSVTSRVESKVDFGSVSIAGHTIKLASKAWNPTIAVANFVVKPSIYGTDPKKNMPDANGGGTQKLPEF